MDPIASGLRYFCEINATSSWRCTVDLRAPPRPLVRTERHAWAWAIGVVCAVALALLIAFLQFKRPLLPADESVQNFEPDAAPQTTAYVYRCSNGEVRTEPCVERPSPTAVPAPSMPITSYTPPRLADTPTGRRLIADADARYRREVEAARSVPSTYESTVAIVNSPECRTIRRERDDIRALMRRGYSAQVGEHYRRRYFELGQVGVRRGCWTGTAPQG